MSTLFDRASGRHRQTSVRHHLCLLLGLGATACGTFSNHLTPAPTAPGEVDIGAGLGVLAGERGLQNAVVLFNPELRLRVGLVDRVDIGAKLNLVGVELNSRILLLESEVFDLGVAPAVGLSLATLTSEETESLILAFKLPVLMGVKLSEMWTIVLGPTGIVHRAASGTVIGYVGGTAGVNIQIIDILALFPEVNLYVPYHFEVERWRKVLVQAGLALRITLGGD